ncbi:MAG: hypothetical protein PHQ12_07435 [Chthoniobacteraceae bacterium]|nr:hypothetical protein [Chthoniobacteraceae bacterium]
MNPQGMMFDEWREKVGISRTACSRYRGTIINGRPMLTVSGNINGLLFITPEEDELFWRRARAGEFAKIVKTPGKHDTTIVDLEDVPPRARRRKGRKGR